MDHNIPDLLKKNPVFKDLKLLATIAKKENSIDWALFFKDDLWLIPLSKNAIEEAKKASDTTIPHMGCSQIVLRNANGSKFWYEDDDPTSEWKKDLILSLPINTKLEQLNKGKWYPIVLGDGPKVNLSYWRSSGTLATTDKILVFPAPKCHLINKAGTYADYHLSFGLMNTKEPFLSLDRADDLANVGKDSPFIWATQKRNDDLLVLRNAPIENDELLAEDFVDKPLKFYLDNTFVNRQKSKDFRSIFDNKTPTDVKPWLYIHNHQRVTVCYARGIVFDKLNDTTKPETDPTRMAYTILLQNCKKEYTQLLAKLYHLTGFCHKAYQLLQQTKIGIKNALASNPMGIVPEIDNAVFNIPAGISYVSEWSAEDPGNACNVQYSFTLKKTMVFNGDLTQDNYKSTNPFRINVNSTQSEAILIKKPVFGIKMLEQQTGDNGSLFRTRLEGYETDSVKIIDGAFEFELGPVASVDTQNYPKKFGQIRFTLQNKKTQQPFFLWQYRDVSQNSDIVLKYAIEEFSLPIKNVRAAGQDLIGSERFLAPSSVGAVSEGAGERNDSSLVIPMREKNTSPTNKTYLLAFSESVNVGQDYRLDVKLLEVKPEANTDNSSSIKAVLLDTNPQFLGLVDARFLQQPGFDDGAWILARRSQLSLENGAWEILDDSAKTEGFRLVLPAQAIGEAYTKNNVDKNGTGKVADDEGNIILVNGQSIDAGALGEPKEGQPIEFKFGAPALFKIANERLEKTLRRSILEPAPHLGTTRQPASWRAFS
ncbi:hypothetical protein [Flavobacterium sp.]|uniref:hypothetical protein n=1 Tax=Flavobacterium sp. TaxID=239 RepID=UPI0039E53F95